MFNTRWPSQPLTVSGAYAKMLMKGVAKDADDAAHIMPNFKETEELVEAELYAADLDRRIKDRETFRNSPLREAKLNKIEPAQLPNRRPHSHRQRPQTERD